MSEFDPYYKWLGIPPHEQPPNYYRLLGLAPYEEDPEVIQAAADQRMTFIRQLATGPYVRHTQQLLGELAKARLCLLDPDKRRNYREQLEILSQAPAATGSDIAPEAGQSTATDTPEPQPADKATKSGSVWRQKLLKQRKIAAPDEINTASLTPVPELPLPEISGAGTSATASPAGKTAGLPLSPPDEPDTPDKSDTTVPSVKLTSRPPTTFKPLVIESPPKQIPPPQLVSPPGPARDQVADGSAAPSATTRRPPDPGIHPPRENTRPAAPEPAPEPAAVPPVKKPQESAALEVEAIPWPVDAGDLEFPSPPAPQSPPSTQFASQPANGSDRVDKAAPAAAPAADPPVPPPPATVPDAAGQSTSDAAAPVPRSPAKAAPATPKPKGLWRQRQPPEQEVRTPATPGIQSVPGATAATASPHRSAPNHSSSHRPTGTPGRPGWGFRSPRTRALLSLASLLLIFVINILAIILAGRGSSTRMADSPASISPASIDAVATPAASDPGRTPTPETP